MKLNIVPARTGFLWVKLGIQTFMKQPLALAGLFFIYMAAASVLSMIPAAGFVLALAIVPAATLGLMAATQEATKGKFPMPTVLVSAFRAGQQRLRAMLMLGVLYAVACVAVMMLAPLLVDVPPQALPNREAAMMSAAFQKLMLVAGLLYLPISLLFWHAPALVHWHGVPPAKSLFFSIVACLRNAGAFLMYGLGWLGVFFAASMLIGLLSMLTGSPQFAAAAMMPVALLLAAMFTTSIYFTFRDSFLADEEPAPPQEPPTETPPGENP